MSFQVGTTSGATNRREGSYGEAVIELPEHFGLVTNDEGLTVQLTPLGDWLQLYVVEKSPKRIVVREAQGKSGHFDYLVMGVRRGYEDHQVIQPRSLVGQIVEKQIPPLKEQQE